MSIEKKIDDLTDLIKLQSDKIDCIDDKCKSVVKVLGGSGLGEKGLLEQFDDLQESHHKLKRKVRDKDVQNKTLTGLLGGGVGIWEYLKHL